jgi:hypothetical protein
MRLQMSGLSRQANTCNVPVKLRNMHHSWRGVACEAILSTPRAKSTSCNLRRRTGGWPTTRVWQRERLQPYFIDAIEDSDILLIDPPSHEQLVGRVPGYAAAFRMGLQRRAAAREERIVNTLSKSAEERYLDFLETYPSIVTRVPQWMLASYLGVSP